MAATVSIGDAARRSGVKVPTIRYYESIGLLPATDRTNSGRRSFGTDELRRLAFIRHARELGFEIEDIRELLALSDEPQQSCERADEVSRRHLAKIDRRLRSLKRLRKELARMCSECRGGRIADCRVIEILADHGKCLAHEHERLA